MRIRDLDDEAIVQHMYRNHDFERERLELDALRLELEQIKAEIHKLRAGAANEYAQAIELVQSTSQISKD